MEQNAGELYRSLVEILERCASAKEMEVSTFQVEGDAALSAKSAAAYGDVVNIRLNEATILLDINDSDAVEFDADDPDDETMILETVKGFCEKTLELHVGHDDHACFGWRNSGREVRVSEPMFRKRSSRIWRRVR
ncbi:hypothetical protein [Actinophytocola xinjiangensis]|uniref:hypothetical protein n=1 Tax=Actinophytocola xinjiangensis TaxID=485602 RepID=UPI0012B8AFBB|nr:hypothetical protein [Actinophytocola xinjiangensis]